MVNAIPANKELTLCDMSYGPWHDRAVRAPPELTTEAVWPARDAGAATRR